MLTPKADLETLTAAGRSQKLSHDELKKVRFQTASSLWTRAIPDEKPVVIDRGDVLVVANLSAAKSEELADTAEAVEGRLREEVMGGKPPLIKGGIVAYGFARGYDLSSFWQTAFSDDRPKGVTAAAGVLGDVVYAAVVPPAGGKSPAEKPSAGKHDGQADASALLTEQMTTAALLGRGVPAWFAKGAGRAVAQVHRAGAWHPVGADGVVDRQTLEHHPSAVVGHGGMCTVYLGRGSRGGGHTVTLVSARHHRGLGECAHAGRYCDDPC